MTAQRGDLDGSQVGAEFRLFGVPIPADVARDADDGTFVMERGGGPVKRFRTEAVRVVRPRCWRHRPVARDVPDALECGEHDAAPQPAPRRCGPYRDAAITDYLRQKGER